MKLQTEIPKFDLGLEIDHSSQLLFIGSCFAENIGNKLERNKFNTLINPLGISYNPLSLFNLINRSLENEKFKEAEISHANDRYFSFDLHSEFSSMKREEILDNANGALTLQSDFLKEADCIFISLGTAYAYILKEEEVLVNNCHKQPSSLFDKLLISKEDIVKVWSELLDEIREHSSKDLKIVFTVSPIRHLKDGFHENQISKATLLMAVDEICSHHKNCFYFPSYEIMMDELRDYRFYAKDLVHPSELAIEIIWERFQKACMNEQAQKAVAEIDSLLNSLEHRAFEPRSKQHQDFLNKLQSKMKNAEQKLGITFKNELADLQKRLTL